MNNRFATITWFVFCLYNDCAAAGELSFADKYVFALWRYENRIPMSDISRYAISDSSGKVTISLRKTRVLHKHKGTKILISRTYNRLYLLDVSGAAKSIFTISVGAPETPTPKGKAFVVSMEADPSWVVPTNMWSTVGRKIVPPGRENPLGSFKIRLNWNGILIHGSDDPYSIGVSVSNGCIRMMNDDIEALSKQIVVGDRVQVID